ncbi:hypothetical protein JCM8547_005033 [Rhodosporidiobolus lusitaniae]
MSSSTPTEVYTTSDIMLQTLVDAGITHAYSNLGSDHPALLEAFARRAKYNMKSLKIITSPNEMVALSAAQGYAQVIGKPAAVIVHVDCGTQALAGAVHNVSTCRTPVFIYAGASPYSENGELAGSRNEFIHWLQNATDQPQIVRQYMRHVGEIRSGKNTQQVMLRALQFATSEPKGPVYVWAQREATEEHIDEKSVVNVADKPIWSGLEPNPINNKVVARIADALIGAKKPLIVTSYLGRNPAAVDALKNLVELLGIGVFQSALSVVNLPFDHPSHLGVAFGGKNTFVEEADVILIIDSDVPWLPMFTKPRPDAQIFHLDVDPLKERMAFATYPAQLRCKADAQLALEQLYDYATSSSKLASAQSSITSRRKELEKGHGERKAALLELENVQDDIATAPFIVGKYREIVEAQKLKSLVLNEAISNYPHVWNHAEPKSAGTLLSSGASSLGWALGAAIGAYHAGEVAPELKSDIHTVFVGDGSYIFGVPSAAFWMARRYETPFLTVVFNNGGWKSPRLSLLGVHPHGLGSAATVQDLNVSFGGPGNDDSINPDYGGIAAAAGGAWSRKVTKASEVEDALKEAIQKVTVEKRSAVLDIWLTRFGPGAP